MQLLWLFIMKLIENIIGTAKTIFVQKNKILISGCLLTISVFLSYFITKSVVQSSGIVSMIVVSVASGIGCTIAMMISDRFSKDRTYVNVILSEDKEQMQKIRDFLAEHHITYVATESFAKGWDKKTISITAYARTKAESRLIDEYITLCPNKIKRMISET